MAELTQDEQLALLKAMDAVISPKLKQLKQDASYELRDAFSENGTEKRAIMINGMKVGDIALSFDKPKPRIVPGMELTALRHMMESGMINTAKVSSLLPLGWEKHFDQAGDAVIDRESGEIISWLMWDNGGVRNATVRGCNPEDVIPSLQRRLGDTELATLMLGGAE